MASHDCHRIVSPSQSLHPKSTLTFTCRDRIADGIRQKYGLGKQELSLAQVLESATWKGGREMAKKLRPVNGGPPIEIESDGTVF